MSEDTLASAAWSTNTAWSHDVYEVLGTHRESRARTARSDFLYRHDDLRQRIEKLRAQQGARPAPEPAPLAADHDDIVHIPTVKLRQERDARRTEISELEQQLAAAQGELLRLRRLLQQHGVSVG